MGFIGGGKQSRKRRVPETGNSFVVKKSRPDPITASGRSISCHTRQMLTLEHLPNEILHPIFVYSGNFDLPMVSRVLNMKLSGSPVLKYEMIRRYMTDSCKIPVSVCTRRFVTKDLLTLLGINEFVDRYASELPKIPRRLEKGELTERKQEIIAYMLVCGCVAGDGPRLVYSALLQGLEEFVRVLVEKGVVINHEVLEYAAGHDVALLNFFVKYAHLETAIGDDVAFWKFLIGTENLEVINMLRSYGISPPYSALNF
ncbi:hypothetical protein TRVA0_029S01464 [Trichomonascus vanleenenianus]|uniref:uncharacterized protein n=1 Tax=Trichomonascus vanleenenianus TaxID=2268995 RepID=UPI003ECB090F